MAEHINIVGRKNLMPRYHITTLRHIFRCRIYSETFRTCSEHVPNIFPTSFPKTACYRNRLKSDNVVKWHTK